MWSRPPPPNVGLAEDCVASKWSEMFTITGHWITLILVPYGNVLRVSMQEHLQHASIATDPWPTVMQLRQNPTSTNQKCCCEEFRPVPLSFQLKRRLALSFKKLLYVKQMLLILANATETAATKNLNMMAMPHSWAVCIAYAPCQRSAASLTLWHHWQISGVITPGFATLVQSKNTKVY